MRRLVVLLSVLALTVVANAKPKMYTLTSPDGRLVTHIVVDGEGMTYDLGYDGKQLMLPSELGLYGSSAKAEFGTLRVKKTTRRTVDETISSPFTRQSSMRNHYNELTLKLYQGFSVVFHAYNEGIAYRYVRDEDVPCRLSHEVVQYTFARNWTTTAAYVSQFDSTNHSVQYSSSFENQYKTMFLNELDPRRLCFLPLMMHCDNGTKVCITESSLCDYPGLYLHGSGESGILVGNPNAGSNKSGNDTVEDADYEEVK